MQSGTTAGTSGITTKASHYRSDAIQARITASPSLSTLDRPISGMATPGSVLAMR